MHPYQSGQLADDRRRQALAQAGQGYLAAPAVEQFKAARRAQRAKRRIRRALHRALRLRSAPGQ